MEMGGFTAICSSEFGGLVRRDFACSAVVCRLPTLHSPARISMACVQYLPRSTKGLPVQNRHAQNSKVLVLLLLSRRRRKEGGGGVERSDTGER